MNASNPDQHVRAKERAWLLAEKYAGQETPEFFADLERLAQGVPLAYVIGWVDFLGARIDLSEHPLIPRPETEWWTERLIAKLAAERGPDAVLRILDLFAGSGAIGIALARALPHAAIVSADIADRAIRAIRMNAERNGCANRVEVVESDLFASIRGTFDVIVANPPYIDPAHPETIEASVLAHEPHEALFGGEGGLAIIERFLAESPGYLADDGILAMEFGKGQEHAIAGLAAALPFATVEIANDQYGIPRWILATKENTRGERASGPGESGGI